MKRKIHSFKSFITENNSVSDDVHPITHELPERVKTIYDAEKFFLLLAKYGLMFHWDDSAEDIFGNGYYPGRKIDDLLDQTIKVCSDNYGDGGYISGGLWEGFIKGSVPSEGLTAFSANDNYVYVVDETAQTNTDTNTNTNIIRVPKKEWDKALAENFDEDSGEYTEGIGDWFDSKPRFKFRN